jgi:hypothetical protein
VIALNMIGLGFTHIETSIQIQLGRAIFNK